MGLRSALLGRALLKNFFSGSGCGSGKGIPAASYRRRQKSSRIMHMLWHLIFCQDMVLLAPCLPYRVGCACPQYKPVLQVRAALLAVAQGPA